MERQVMFQLTSKVGEIRAALAEAAEKPAKRDKYLTAASRHIDELEQLSAQSAAGQTMEAALGECRRALEQIDSDSPANDLIREPTDELLNAEMQLYAALAMKRTLLRKLIGSARRLLVLPAPKRQGWLGQLPHNGEELIKVLRAWVDDARKAFGESESLPRRQKKERRSAVDRICLGAAGLTLAFGGLLLSPLTGGQATPATLASIASGIFCLGAAVSNEPSLARQTG